MSVDHFSSEQRNYKNLLKKWSLEKSFLSSQRHTFDGFIKILSKDMGTLAALAQLGLERQVIGTAIGYRRCEKS